MSDTLATLEAALAASPHDVALLSAVADYFLEAGDPRGEFLRLCLTRDFAAAELLGIEHRAALQGPLAAFWPDWVRPLAWYYCWPRSVLTYGLTPAILAAIVASPLVNALDVRCWPGNPDRGKVGDDGIDRLIDSGLLRRLVSLSLSACGVTDDGAEALARCPDVARLRSLRMDGNLLSPIGIAALAAVGHPDVGPQAFGPGGRPAGVVYD